MRSCLLAFALALAGCGARTELAGGSYGASGGGGAGGAASACAPVPSPMVLYASDALWGDLIGDGQRLYVPRDDNTGQSTFDVQSVDPCTGTAITLGKATPLSAATPPIVPWKGSVYWVNAPGIGDAQDLVRGGPLGGSAATLMSLGTEVDAMAFGGGILFAVAGDETLFAVPVAGGAHTVLAPDAFPTNPIVDGSVVYYARSPGGIGRVGVTGGALEVLPPKEQVCVDPNSLRALVADEANLYTVTRQSNQVWRVPKDGSPPALLAQASWCSELALDDAYLYFTDSAQTPNAASVNRVPKTGGAVEMVAVATDPWGIYVDAHSVYWMEFGAGELMKVDK
jgi:hypothetical protein